MGILYTILSVTRGRHCSSLRKWDILYMYSLTTAWHCSGLALSEWIIMDFYSALRSEDTEVVSGCNWHCFERVTDTVCCVSTDAQVADIACSHDGKYLFSVGGQDLTVNMWRINTAYVSCSLAYLYLQYLGEMPIGYYPVVTYLACIKLYYTTVSL